MFRSSILLIAVTMSDYDEEKLAEDIHEFDRLMAAHDARQSKYDAPDFIVTDDINFSSKPDVDADDAQLDGIELVELPVPDDKEKSKRLAA